jgi:hypothetical protein
VRFRGKLFLVAFLVLVLTGLWLYNLYSYPPAESVKPKIQKYLDKEFNGQFEIKDITIHYSSDLFHQPDCYNLTLIAKEGIQIDKIRLQFNKVQHKWIPCHGTDIQKKYIDALNRRKS